MFLNVKDIAISFVYLSMNCFFCGKDAGLNAKTGNEKKYCNSTCMYKYHTLRRGIDHSEKQCKFCQKLFRPLTLKTNYCSIQCLRSSEKLSKQKKFVPINCKECSKVFTPRLTKQKHCSKKCWGAWDSKIKSKKPETKVCKNCQSVFKPYTSLDKYCCIACRNASQPRKTDRRWPLSAKQKRYGENNPAFVHGLSVRGSKRSSVGIRLFHKKRDELKENLLNKHGYLSCQNCGKSGVKLETHHIVYRSEKPNHDYLHEHENLLLVCVKCHNQFHKHKGMRNDIVIERGLHLLFGNDILDK